MRSPAGGQGRSLQPPARPGRRYSAAAAAPALSVWLRRVQGEPVFKTVWGVGLLLMASQVLLYSAAVQAAVAARKAKAA